ncbi:MAG: ATP-dependent nuclease [Candidatus Heimdallarchaeaceae archaeon]
MENSESKIMYISEITITNFRSIEEETFYFKPFSILIGKNNTGKSNIMTSLKLLLEGTNRDFSIRDFHNSSNNIVFEAKIQSVENFLELSSEPHKTKIKEDIQNGYLKVRRIIEPGPKVNKLEVFDLKKGDYGLKTGIENALKQLLPEVIFIEAFQDPSIEAHGKSSATLGKIIKQILSRIQEQTSEQIEKAFKKANHLLNVYEVEIDGEPQEVDQRAEDIKNIEAKIRRNLQNVFGDVDVRIKIDFPKVPELMVNSRIELLDSGTWTPPELKGQGVQRALYVALLRSLAEQLREEKDTTGLKRPFLLLVEEPEIFLHPSVLGTMRNALEEISSTNQVLIATHSPSMISRNNLSNVILVRKTMKEDEKGKTVKLNKDGEQLDQPNEKRLRHLLEYQRSSKFLFANKVIVVEGPSDVVLFESIIETWTNQSLDSLGLAIIDSGSKDIAVECAGVLRSIGLDVICIFDVDFLWRGAGKICNSSDYSNFLNKFWENAEQEGIVEKDNDGKNRIKKDEKSKAAEIITQNFQKERKNIYNKLKDNKIWVLSHGEIEHYVGLSHSSKGKYVEIAKKIRNGKQEIIYKDDLKNIFLEGLGLEIKEENIDGSSSN